MAATMPASSTLRDVRIALIRSLPIGSRKSTSIQTLGKREPSAMTDLGGHAGAIGSSQSHQNKSHRHQWALRKVVMLRSTMRPGRMSSSHEARQIKKVRGAVE